MSKISRNYFASSDGKLTDKEIAFGSSDNLITSSSNLKFNSSTKMMTITSDETADDSVMLKLETDTFDGTMMRIVSRKAHASGADNDGPNIELYRSSTGVNARDLASYVVEYFKIMNYISTATTGSEDSLVMFKALNDGVDDDFMRLRGGAGVIINDNGRSNIDFRVESDTMSHAIAVDASTNRVGLLHDAMGDIEAAVDVKLPDGESVIIRNSATDANAGPILDLYRDNTDEADDDIIGQIKFSAMDDGNVKQQYINIKGKIIDASAGSEAGSLVVTPTGTDNTTDAAGAFQVRDGSITSYAPVLLFRADATNQMNLTNEDLQSKTVVYDGSNVRQTLKLPTGVVGMRVKFVSTQAQGFTVDPDNSSTGNTVNGVTTSITRNPPANTINELFCYEAAKWICSNESA